MRAMYQNPSVHYIPAQPGWVVGIPNTCTYDEETFGIGGMDLEPIICWQMVTEISESLDEAIGSQHTLNTWANPVTAHGVWDDEADIVIGQPDGTFVCQGLHDFESADEVLAEWRGAAQNRHEILSSIKPIVMSSTP